MVSSVLLIASYYDYRYRMIPDCLHILLLVIGLIDFNYSKAISGLIFSPLPFLIMALVQTGSIGGGDIKLIGATGFVLGYSFTFFSALIGLLMVVIVSVLSFSFRKSKCKQLFPFAPYYQLGYTSLIVLQIQMENLNF